MTQATQTYDFESAPLRGVFTDQQVKALVETFTSFRPRVRTSLNAKAKEEMKAEIKDELRDELATKDFVRAEIAEVRNEISEMKAELKDGMRKQTAWLSGLLITTMLALFALLKLL